MSHEPSKTLQQILIEANEANSRIKVELFDVNQQWREIDNESILPPSISRNEDLIKEVSGRFLDSGLFYRPENLVSSARKEREKIQKKLFTEATPKIQKGEYSAQDRVITKQPS